MFFGLIFQVLQVAGLLGVAAVLFIHKDRDEKMLPAAVLFGAAGLLPVVFFLYSALTGRYDFGRPDFKEIVVTLASAGSAIGGAGLLYLALGASQGSGSDSDGDDYGY